MIMVLIIDTETTGVVEPEPIEIAWAMINDIETLAGVKKFEARYKPTKAISLGAMSTHHIMDEDLVDCDPSGSFSLPEGAAYLIGHNVDFDWKVIGSPEVKRICTLALSRDLYPGIDSHTLAAMFYHLERDSARFRLENAHSAFTDVMLCRDILKHIVKLLGVTTWDELWLASESARIPSVMPFGKHKGIAIKDIPADYKQWLLKQPDVDPYLASALRGGKEG